MKAKINTYFNNSKDHEFTRESYKYYFNTNGLICKVKYKCNGHEQYTIDRKFNGKKRISSVAKSKDGIVSSIKYMYTNDLLVMKEVTGFGGYETSYTYDDSTNKLISSTISDDNTDPITINIVYNGHLPLNTAHSDTDKRVNIYHKIDQKNNKCSISWDNKRTIVLMSNMVRMYLEYATHDMAISTDRVTDIYFDYFDSKVYMYNKQGYLIHIVFCYEESGYTVCSFNYDNNFLRTIQVCYDDENELPVERTIEFHYIDDAVRAIYNEYNDSTSFIHYGLLPSNRQFISKELIDTYVKNLFGPCAFINLNEHDDDMARLIHLSRSSF